MMMVKSKIGHWWEMSSKPLEVPKDLDSLKGIFLLLATVVTIIGSQALLKF